MKIYAVMDLNYYGNEIKGLFLNKKMLKSILKRLCSQTMIIWICLFPNFLFWMREERRE